MIEELEKYFHFYGKKYPTTLYLTRGHGFYERAATLEKKEVFSEFGGSETYFPEVIREILSNEDYLENLLAIYKNKETSVIEIQAFRSEKIASRLCSYKNSSMLNFLEAELKNIPEEKRAVAEKYIKQIQREVDPSVLLQDDSVYTCVMDGKELSARRSDLARLFIDGFAAVLFDGVDSCKSDGLSGQEFLYLALCWAQSENIFVKYRFNSDARVFFDDLRNDRIVDFYAVNRLNETKNDFTRGAKINPKLVDYVFSKMPEHFSKIQKATYIYFKLCQALSYDAGFYASNQQGRAAEFHSRLENISEISPENSEVVCYEFSAIYGEMLNMIGVDYNFNNLYNDYGGGHANLSFKADGVIVEVEPLKSVLGSDFCKAKFEGRVEGLSCQNSNPATKERFRNDLLSVTQYVTENEPNDSLNESFEFWTSYYDSLCEQTRQLSEVEKFRIMRIEMQRVDGASTLSRIIYLKRLCDRIFAKEKEEGSFELVIMSKKFESERTTAMPVVVLAFNRLGEVSAAEEDTTRYILYDSDVKFTVVSKEELIRRMKAKELGFINEMRSIPGINYEKVFGEEE